MVSWKCAQLYIQRSKRSNSTAHKIAVHLPSFLWPPEADDNHWLTAFDDDVTAWEEKSIVWLAAGGTTHLNLPPRPRKTNEFPWSCTRGGISFVVVYNVEWRHTINVQRSQSQTVQPTGNCTREMLLFGNEGGVILSPDSIGQASFGFVSALVLCSFAGQLTIPFKIT